MIKNGEVRYDEKGFPWKVDLRKSMKYPNGMIRELVLVASWGTKTKVYYNEAGEFIAGNPALA